MCPLREHVLLGSMSTIVPTEREHVLLGNMVVCTCRGKKGRRWPPSDVGWNEGCGKACGRPLLETNGGDKLQEESNVLT